MKKTLCILIAALFLSCCLLTGCKHGSRAIIDTNTLRVEAAGRATTVQDLATGSVYRFTERPARPGHRRTEPETVTNTKTVKIELLPGRRIRITDKSAGTVYTLARHEKGIK